MHLSFSQGLIKVMYSLLYGINNRRTTPATTEDAAYLPIHMKYQYIDNSSNSDQVLYKLHKS